VSEAVIGHVRDYFLAYNERVFSVAGDLIDIFMMGDDFGAQHGPLIAPDLWRKLFRPGFKSYIDLAHRHGIRVMHHTCGSVVELIPDFIECGLDILQSLQPGAKGMDLAALKREFGRDLSFHGSVDIQQTMPRGTEAEVRAEVAARMAAGKPNGGFIICTAHNLQPDVPLRNVFALIEAYDEFGGY
jgi:uroporphyrinogen decarboxylase